jgi:hypothetical protein
MTFQNRSIPFGGRISTKFFTLLTFMVLALFASIASANGVDGKVGAIGEIGKSGRSGRASINWVPRDPNPEWFFYFPIKNGEVEEFKKVLSSGAKINWPMSNIIGRPSAFQVAIESRWYEGLRIMFENTDPKNRPDVRDTTVFNRNKSRLNVYEFLIFGDSLDEHGNLEPNFAVRSDELEIFKMVLNATERFDDLEYSTGRIRPALLSEQNRFRQYPTNIEAAKAIEDRLLELKSN